MRESHVKAYRRVGRMAGTGHRPSRERTAGTGHAVGSGISRGEVVRGVESDIALNHGTTRDFAFPRCGRSSARGAAAGPHRPQPQRPARLRQVQGIATDPPRAWGSQAPTIKAGAVCRSIPTCVGLTGSSDRCPRTRPVHPHVRGAHRAWRRAATFMGGPSPRAWGSPGVQNPRAAHVRSIPTCVGLTHGHRPTGPARRSIPTCVGLTATRRCPGSSETVHPHVRGAHLRDGVWVRAATGPSPRAWGSLPRHHRPSVGSRSIPTCVGLTGNIPRILPSPAVHPHVRGAHS